MSHSRNFACSYRLVSFQLALTVPGAQISLQGLRSDAESDQPRSTGGHLVSALPSDDPFHDADLRSGRWGGGGAGGTPAPGCWFVSAVLESSVQFVELFWVFRSGFAVSKANLEWTNRGGSEPEGRPSQMYHRPGSERSGLSTSVGTTYCSL